MQPMEIPHRHVAHIPKGSCDVLRVSSEIVAVATILDVHLFNKTTGEPVRNFRYAAPPCESGYDDDEKSGWTSFAVSGDELFFIDNLGYQIRVYNIEGHYLRHFEMSRPSCILAVGDELFVSTDLTKCTANIFVLDKVSGALIRKFVPGPGKDGGCGDGCVNAVISIALHSQTTLFVLDCSKRGHIQLFDCNTGAFVQKLPADNYPHALSATDDYVFASGPGGIDK
eukprot:gene5390-5612_t